MHRLNDHYKSYRGGFLPNHSDNRYRDRYQYDHNEFYERKHGYFSVRERQSDKNHRWMDLDIHPLLLKSVPYASPRPIQRSLISQMRTGSDVIAKGELGGGKTAAFGLGVLDGILKLSEDERSDAVFLSAPLALILVPTRELASQTFETLKNLSVNTNLVICVSYGQMSRAKSLNEIQRGCHILIGTCGRILDFMHSRQLSLKLLRFLVIDEADAILDDTSSSSHFRQLIAFQSFLDSSENRQTILTSATFPKAIETMSRNIMRPAPGWTGPVRVVCGNVLNERITLRFIETRTKFSKESRLYEIFDVRQRYSIEKTIVFMAKKSDCNVMAERWARDGAVALHGDLPQHVRNECIEGFRRGEYRVIFATNVMARGIDIPDLTRVINYDLPRGNPDFAFNTFLHRAGRAGRRSPSIVISFVSGHLVCDRHLATKLFNFHRQHTGREVDDENILRILRDEEARNPTPAHKRPIPEETEDDHRYAHQGDGPVGQEEEGFVFVGANEEDSDDSDMW